MRRIVKDTVPDFWDAYLHKNPKSRYDDLEKTAAGQQLRRQLREHMLTYQKMICCYCCKSVDFSSTSVFWQMAE